MFNSCLKLTNGTIITPLLLFQLELGLVCTKYYRLVEYIPVKCFNTFVQSTVNARRQRDGNFNSSIAAETMELLAQLVSLSKYETQSPVNYKVYE